MTLEEMIKHLEEQDTSDPCSVNSEPIIAVLRAAQKMRNAVELATDAHGLHIANLDGESLIRACEAYDVALLED